MKFIKTYLILFVLSNSVFGQKDSFFKQKSIVGVELDALPFVTGGYFGAVAAGRNHWRVRGLYTKVNMPDWFIKEGFKNHQINSFAIIYDRFIKSEWKGWWIGGGPVFWNSNIQNKTNFQNSSLNNVLLNGSLGYNFFLGKRIYISPWAGMSVRVSGDKDVSVGGAAFTIPLLNPETSFKLGYKFR